MAQFGDLLKQAKESGAMGDAVIPDGDFTLEVTKTNFNDKDGKESIGLLWKVLATDEGEDIPEDDEAHNAVGWTNLYFSPAAAGISFRQLKQFGFDETYLAESESVEQVAEAAKGIQITASVGHRFWGTDNDRCSNEFKGITVVVPPAVGAAPLAEADPAEVGAGPV